MDAPRAYATAGAFRKALEERLKRISQAEQMDINRLRRQVSFDRLLARLFRVEPAPWALKGGYALELRFKTARSTIDIDLSLQPVVAATDQADASRVREMLQNAASIPLGDWFEYTIGSPVMDVEAAPYGGARYPVEARMDARVFSRFHLDAGIGDAVMEPLETVECREWLEFAGIKGPRVLMIPREQQFAEKLHAYTLPRSTANSRVKDLVDLALLIESGGLATERIQEAVSLTFQRRGTHVLPSVLLPPPADWKRRFEALAEECRLPKAMDAVFDRVRAYVEAVLPRGPQK
jgi:Nucleotidyl transferase AbiEii toxin, Type IV TA system